MTMLRETYLPDDVTTTATTGKWQQVAVVVFGI